MTDGKLLILGGTGLAADLSGAVAELGLRAVYSLAGRTAPKSVPGIEQRSGGFGGADALAAYLAAEKIFAVIDATHAYAAQISDNAQTACDTARVPLLRLATPPWQAVAGDHWLEVPDMAAARDTAAGIAARVFVSTGRQAMAGFADDRRCWWLARVIAPGDDLPMLANGDYVYDRGPFALSEELKLLRAHGIEAVISKNAGGTATQAKIAAARELGLPVIMIARPSTGDIPLVETVDAAMAWLKICLV